MKKYRIFVIMLCVIMLFGIAACNKNDGGGKDSDSSVQSGGPSANVETGTGVNSGSGENTSAGGTAAPVSTKDTLRVAVSSDSGTLAHENVSGDLYAACKLVNEPLWDHGRMAADDDLIFLLAESVDVHDAVHWTIHLRHGVKFSNGNPFTASDVKFSVATTMKGSNGPARTQLMNLDHIIILDDYTIDWTWDNYHIGQFGIISDVLIYDEESYDPEQASLAPIGTGPYVVTDYVVNSQVLLERRDDYWGKRPDFKYINFRVLGETSQVVNALETGNIDIAHRIATQDIAYVDSLPGIKVVTRYDTNFATVGFNVRPVSRVHDVNARYAICYAINRQAIVDVVYDGLAVVLNRPNCNTTMDNEPRFDNMHETYSVGYNVERARQYAEKAGLVGTEIRAITNGAAAYVLTAEMVQKMLEEIGITLTISNYDAASYMTFMRTDPDKWDISIGGGINPGYRVASPMVMGVTFYPDSHRDPDTGIGYWEGYDEYVARAYSFFNTFSPQERSDITYFVLDLYERNALGFGICDIESATAISTELDPDSFVYRMNGNMRYADVKLAG